jgi:branched-chain amino acid transport system substrate-binding protein
VAAAACSSSKSTKTSTNTTAGSTGTTAAAGSASTAAAAASGTPIKIAFMGIETGTFAAPDRHNTIQMAVDQLNAQGGIMGHKVEWTAYDTGILPQTTVTAVTKAIADHPTVMIGLSVSSGVAAAAPLIKASGIPTLQYGSDIITDLSKTGATNLFRIGNTNIIESNATAKYMLAQNPKTAGIWDDSDTNGVATTDIVSADLTAAGVKVTRRHSPQGATDTTAQALAMKGQDIIEVNGFPQTDALFVKTVYQNGVTAPLVLTYGDETIQAFGLAPQAALDNAVYQSNCDPDAVHSPQADAYVAAYKAKYGASVTQTVTPVPGFYDAVNMIASVVKANHGDISPTSIVNGLKTLDYTGVCGQYKTDSENNMGHTAWIVSLKGGPAQKTLITTYPNLASH